MKKNMRLMFLFARALICLSLLSPLPASANRVVDYVNLKAQQQWKQALQKIRQEIKSPLVSEDSYLSDINMLGLDGLGNYAHYYGYTTEMDAEAKEYFRKARSTAGDDKVRQARAYHGLFNYYSKSARNGLALPWIWQELKIWQELGNTYQVLINHDATATAYTDMGELELRDYYREKVLKLADEYFVLGEHPSDANEWLNYSRILQKHIDNHARTLTKSEMEGFWEKIEAITDEYVAPRSISRYNIAKLFAINGQDSRALELLEEAEEIYEDEKDSIPTIQDAIETDLACARAQVDFQAGRTEKAVNGFLICENKWKDIGKDMGGSTWGLLGLAYEKGQKLDLALAAYDRSIKSVEDTRRSFSVAERATFFRNRVIRRPYWGSIRIFSKIAQTSKKEKDFARALQATEKIRARQFGELLSAETQQSISIESLGELRSQLSKDTLVLDYVIADDDLVILAFNSKIFKARVIPYDRKRMRNLVRNISRQLASHTSKPESLQKNLMVISNVMLQPVVDMLEGHKNVLVLPDGELNLVPFDLLSIDSNKYKPLINYAAVSNLPSLRFLQKIPAAARPATAGIFAVADPKYPGLEDIRTVEQEALIATTRNINLRGYFSPLPETRDEVNDIAKLFSGKKNTLLLGDSATESAVKGTDLSQFRVLHLATHGILGGEVPGIGEPALIFGKDDFDDGFLKASEVQELHLNAELAVLSACNTGSGKLFSGEGVMGMSRAFLLAGSKSVVVSLWPVASKATQDLMVRFYRHFNSGKPKAQALRAAKLELKKTLPHPFFWSPFILVGQQ